jgi:hypothetical protein
MEETMCDLQQILDANKCQINEGLEYGDLASTFDGLRRYREFAIRFINADCDLMLVKISSGAIKKTGNHIP